MSSVPAPSFVDATLDRPAGSGTVDDMSLVALRVPVGPATPTRAILRFVERLREDDPFKTPGVPLKDQADIAGMQGAKARPPIDEVEATLAMAGAVP